MTYGLVAAILGTALSGSELWPLSQFELFSSVRSGESVAWQLVTVDADGAEAVVDLGGVPPRLGLVHHLLPRLNEQEHADQQESVRLWLHAAVPDRPEPASVRIYQVRQTTPTVAGHQSEELDRTLVDEIPLR